MPLGSSPYGEPPYPAGRNAELLLVEFEADPRAMTGEVPEPLRLVKGSKALAWIFNAPQLTGSIYHEGAILLCVRYRGITGHYVPYIWGDLDEAMLLNRELYGWPQLLCEHDVLHKEGNLIYGVIRRREERLLKASVFLERSADQKELPLLADWLQIRKIPTPMKRKPALRHLIHLVISDTSIHELWAGRPSLELGPSAEFRIERLSPSNVTRGFYMRISHDLPHANNVIEVPQR